MKNDKNKSDSKSAIFILAFLYRTLALQYIFSSAKYFLKHKTRLVKMRIDAKQIGSICDIFLPM